MTGQAQPSAVPLDYSYAVLRILYGAIGCGFLLGLADVGKFWDPTGLVPLASGGWKAAAISSGWGVLAGRAVFAANVVAFLAMLVGWRSREAVAVAFVTSTLQASWNPLPLSAAFQVMRSVLFCLIWADTGRVWSLDARARSAAMLRSSPSIIPLRVICVQIALVYLATGLWKLGSPEWQDGSALYYVLATNGFSRLPTLPGLHFTTLLTSMTHLVLLWELAFPFMVLVPWARALALGLGVAFHLGMWLTMDLGPFPWVMLASYVAFIRPSRLVAGIAWARRLVGRAPEVSIVGAQS